MVKSIFLSLLAILLAACTRDKVEDVMVNIDSEDTVYASIDAPECRVELNDKCQTVWTKDDEIMVVSANEYSLYRFNGNTGDRSGSFKKIGYGNPPSASIKFGNKSYALYGNYSSYGAYSNGTPVLFTEIQSQQTYKEESYGLYANAMVGTSEGDNNFIFKNLLGYLRLSVTGNRSISKITLMGNDKEIISGIIYFAITDFSQFTWRANTSSSIVLDCGAGVALSAEPTSFYFVVPPMTFQKGFTVTIDFTDGTSYTQTTSKAISIERNTIQPMKTINTNPDSIEYKEVTIDHTGEYIITPLLENAISGSIDWGDGEVSLFNKFSSHDFVDKKSSHTIKIEVVGATAIELESCEGVSKIDLSNF